MGVYIHYFETEADFNQARSNHYSEPWVSYTEGVGVNFNKSEEEKLNTPLTFEIISDGYITWKSNDAPVKTIEYKKNDGDWTEITSNTESTTECFVVNNLKFPITSITYIPIGQGAYMAYNGSVNVYLKSSSVNIGTTVYSDPYFNTVYGTVSSFETIVNTPPRINVVSGDIVQFRSNNGVNSSSSSKYNSFGASCRFVLRGNIMSLVNSTDFATSTSLTNNRFVCLFKGNVGLTDASNLMLPATTLASSCYAHMFNGCTSLTTAPELPATTLASNCYSNMFYNCTSLAAAPALSATTLAEHCYSHMFYGCTSLTTAPELPATTLAAYCYQYMFNNCRLLTTAPALSATTLAEYCYSYMFYGCSGLTMAPELPATTLANSCYQAMFQGCTSLTTTPELPATTLANYCYQYMFQGCTSLTTAPELPVTTLKNYCYNGMFKECTSLTTVPELPATTLATNCYYSMFQNCTSLTTAPELPATTLVNYCYQYMFRNCSKLNYIKAMFTTAPSSTYTGNWVNGVAATGTFVKNASASWTITGVHGVPTGWTVQTASN